MNVLVTGGAGYIGSHTVIELIKNNYKVTIVDNFSNSHPEALNRLKQITNTDFTFIEADLCDNAAVDKLFTSSSFDAVIHFAGLKAVGESIEKPMEYYQNNLLSTLNLCNAMQQHNVTKLVFSSSATVYGLVDRCPITEDFPLSATNPYGQTKLMIEQILRDLVIADVRFQVTLLRYFNPVGAHPSGLIGEDPKGLPNNLFPYVSQVAVGKHREVKVFGDDYDTPDGTGVRDYIHIVDLAAGHVAALKNMPKAGTCEAYNLGTGRGYSVLEVIQAFEQASGKKSPTQQPQDVLGI
jgi:UDP-glucose 4-epimerase